MKQASIMQKSIFIALAVAIFSGFAIGIQVSLNSAAAKVRGAMLTGLLVNFAGGISAGLILAAIYLRRGGTPFPTIQMQTLGLIITAGIIGIGIIIGVAYSLPKIGIAAGLSAIIAGQMVVAILVDTFGLTGGEPIPISWTRLAGLGLLALGAWAILPRE